MLLFPFIYMREEIGQYNQAEKQSADKDERKLQMRKAILSIILIIVVTSCFTSCSDVGFDMGVFGDSDAKIADKTFNEIITAIGLEDGSKIVDMFSNTIKSEYNLSQSAVKFFNFIHGDIVSFSSASEAGVGADYRTENGKKIKEIQSSFRISTTENVYYIAIKECIRDDFDNNNIGIVSIYIIESNNWTEDCVYRGDGKWSPGINIVDTF